MLDLLPYRHIVVADFEFEFGGHASFDDATIGRTTAARLHGREGVAFAGANGGFGAANLARRRRSPSGRDSLFIAYYASAELGCFRALGWPRPANILDLFVEFRNRTNGLTNDRRWPAPVSSVL